MIIFQLATFGSLPFRTTEIHQPAFLQGNAEKRLMYKSSTLRRNWRLPSATSIDAMAKARQSKKLVNDCVHGMIVVPHYCIPVVATPAFQRLGRIRQTGSLYTAWPSAVHTRLEHSLGAMHLANVYNNTLIGNKLDPDWHRVLVLATLLHDIAHGPFSHTFEHAIDGTESGKRFVDHDVFRKELLVGDTALLNAVGGPEVADAICAVWEGSGKVEGLKSKTNWSESDRATINAVHVLLAGVAGVDRMDYILRDSYHTTPQRRLDRTCVQSIMEETSIDLQQGRVEYTEKGEQYVAHFLEERCYLYREVYPHKTAMAADWLLRQAFDAGLEPHIRQQISVENFERLDEGYILHFAWREDLWHGADSIEKSSLFLRRYMRGDIPKLRRVDALSTKKNAQGSEPNSAPAFDLTFSKKGVSAKELNPKDVVCRTNEGTLRPLQFHSNVAIYDVKLGYSWEQ